MQRDSGRKANSILILNMRHVMNGVACSYSFPYTLIINQLFYNYFIDQVFKGF